MRRRKLAWCQQLFLPRRKFLQRRSPVGGRAIITKAPKSQLALNPSLLSWMVKAVLEKCTSPWWNNQIRCCTGATKQGRRMRRFQSACPSTSVSVNCVCVCCECAVLSYLGLKKISKHDRGRVGNEGSPGMLIAMHLHVVCFHREICFHPGRHMFRPLGNTVWHTVVTQPTSLLGHPMEGHSATRSRLEAGLASYPLGWNSCGSHITRMSTRWMGRETICEGTVLFRAPV